MSKANIKKGDTVTVISGDDKGKTGKVLLVSPESGRVLVEGINLVKKHMQKSEENPQGGVVEREAPFAISNVKVSV
ncbi:50S ribosomal protein L24 [Pontiella sulfatireligans]|uniref:Large ribosomal subunit protein uL24 n=1 Tax=Pontiella sulfatireligans TaxID=2750658 RepID=A0A6C2UJY2_9BACT|nr:50S ribosomal protein L24 [Pontiella sulfatireligans]VGO20540.1 50S ribosomal protein L24 [Pontiella sulfatireligans]